MRLTMALVAAAFVASPLPAMSQHGTATVNAPTAPAREANQFDFMIGDWDLSVEVPPTSFATRLHGMPKLVGTWKVRKAIDGWGVEDDLRITDMAGNPASMAHALRYYDRSAKRWIVSALEVYRGRFSTSVAEWRSNQMVSSSANKDADGKPYLLRTRIFDITPNRFRFQQDRSDDSGKNWKEGTLKIEARRAGTKAD